MTMRRVIVIMICINICFSILANNPVRVFTVHPDGDPVNLYLNSDLKDIRIAIYPYREENNAGIEIEILSFVNNSLAVKLGEEYLFCRPGDLAINTRNYDGTPFILYSNPSKDESISGSSTTEQTLKVFGVSKGWLFVKGVDDNGKSIQGWLPSEMQCPSQWTTYP